MTRIVFAVSLLLAIVDAALAAEIRLGPETAVTPGWRLAQTSVRVAHRGNHEISVWSDQQSHLLASANGIVISAGTLGHSFDSPNLVTLAVAASDSNFLVVWYDTTNRMLAQRVTFDGQVLDTPPIILSADSPGSPSIASDGSTYLVSWCAASSVFTLRLASDGTIRSRSTFVTPANVFTGGYPMSPKVAWTGDRFFLGYVLSYASCTSPCMSWSDIGGTPLDATGQPSPLKLFAYLFGFDQGFEPYTTSLALASGGGNVTFVWWTNRDEMIAVAQANADGNPIAEPRTVAKARRSNDYCPITPAIGWDGAEFVVAWIDCDATLRAFRLNPLGSPMEESFEVASNVPRALAGPSIAQTPDGVVIVYSRPDASNGNAPCAFERSLTRLPPPRRRVVSH
jgi:hypothetical protein